MTVFPWFVGELADTLSEVMGYALVLMRRPLRNLHVIAAICGVGLWPSSVEAEEEEVPLGTVVVLGDIEEEAAFDGVRSAGGATWRLERLEPRAAITPPTPTEALALVERLYAEADFLRCLTAVQNEELGLDLLLARPDRESAARSAIYSAACAHGAGDVELARNHLRRALVAGLEVSDTLAETTPELQLIAEEVESEVSNAGRVRLTLTPHPNGARIWLDGVPAECADVGCALEVRRGEHLVVARRIGYLPRVGRMSIERDGERELTLDPAPADVQLEQLREELASEAAPDRIELAHAAADAYGSRVVIMIWTEEELVRAALYDHGLERFVARASCDGSTTAVRAALHSLVHEWRGETEPIPLARRPVFWLVTLGVATAVGVATGLIVWGATRPEIDEHYLVFQ